MNTYSNTLNHKDDAKARAGSGAKKGRLARAARVAGLALALFAAAPASGGLLPPGGNVEVTAQVFPPKKVWSIGSWQVCFGSCPRGGAVCCVWVVL